MTCFLCFCGRFVSNVSVERDDPGAPQNFHHACRGGACPARGNKRFRRSARYFPLAGNVPKGARGALPPATPTKSIASLYVRRVKRGRFGGLLRNAACCDGGLWIFGGVWLKRPTKRKRICRGDLWSPASPPASFGGTPLYKGGIKRRSNLPQHRAAYEVAAALRWDGCQAKALIGAGAQMKGSHFVSMGGYIRGT